MGLIDQNATAKHVRIAQCFLPLSCGPGGADPTVHIPAGALSGQSPDIRCLNGFLDNAAGSLTETESENLEMGKCLEMEVS
eukprot:s125_g10.t1